MGKNKWVKRIFIYKGNLYYCLPRVSQCVWDKEIGCGRERWRKCPECCTYFPTKTGSGAQLKIIVSCLMFSPLRFPCRQSHCFLLLFCSRIYLFGQLSGVCEHCGTEPGYPEEVVPCRHCLIAGSNASCSLRRKMGSPRLAFDTAAFPRSWKQQCFLCQTTFRTWSKFNVC